MAHTLCALCGLFRSDKGVREMRIITDRPAHLMSEAVETEIMVLSGYPEGDGHELSDAAALTIASWFQTPAAHGAVFAELSTTGKVDRDELVDAIDRETALPEYKMVDGYARTGLEYLRSWALSKSPGKVDIPEDVAEQLSSVFNDAHAYRLGLATDIDDEDLDETDRDKLLAMVELAERLGVEF